MAYGVQPEGFVLKRLPEILADIEARALVVYGGGLVQTAQSPMGQLNGLCADFLRQVWETYEDVYSSLDVDQAEGTRLDTLGKLRLLNRGSMSEADFRRLITNADRAAIDLQDIAAAIRSVPDVEFAHVFVNDTAEPIRGQPGRTVAAAVIGGDDDDVAVTVRRYVAPGVSTWGNVSIQTVLDGFCRSVLVIRPVKIPVTLRVYVRPVAMSRACQPPTTAELKAALVADLTGVNHPIPGEALTIDHIRAGLGAFPSVTVAEVVGIYQSPTEIALTEIMDVSADRVTVVYAGDS